MSGSGLEACSSLRILFYHYPILCQFLKDMAPQFCPGHCHYLTPIREHSTLFSIFTLLSLLRRLVLPLASLLCALKMYLARAYMTFPQMASRGFAIFLHKLVPVSNPYPTSAHCRADIPNTLTLRSTHPPLGFISADFLLETHLHRDIHLPSTSLEGH